MSLPDKPCRRQRENAPGLPAPPCIAPAPAPLQATEPLQRTGKFSALLDTSLQETLTVTRWFDPTAFRDSKAASVTVRFSGLRTGITGKPEDGDHFIHDEIVDALAVGDGPISVTARIGAVNPGEWVVSAKAFAGRRSVATRPAAWSTCRWRLCDGEDNPVTTGLAPLAKVPSLVRGGWLTMVILGSIAGLVLQSLLASRQGVPPRSVWPVALLSITVGGMFGAKAWFVVKHHREHRLEGWCIQGFMVGFVVAAVSTLAVVGTPIGVFFDTAAPGLFLGLAIGRVGCLFGGCCGGRPTGSRWGMWSSDQRVGRRRLPTQLMESVLGLAIGLASLGAVVEGGTRGGAIFVASTSAYVLCRQGILRLRAERPMSSSTAPYVVALACVVLVADVIAIALLGLPG